MITIVEQPSLFNFGGKLGAYGTKFGRFYICHQLSCNIPAEDVELHLFITYMIIIPKEPILAILGQICGFLGGGKWGEWLRLTSGTLLIWNQYIFLRFLITS